MVKNHEQWNWSSYKAMAGHSKAPGFLSIDWILGQFSLKKAEAGKRYKNFVREGVPKEQRYLNRPPLPELLEKIKEKPARNKQIAEAYISYGYTMKEIAGTLGIHYTTVSKVIRQQRARS